MSEIGQVAVAVPVRNEVARLSRLLNALAAQRGTPGFVLCLFLDSCTDGSIDLVTSRAPFLPFRLETERCAAGLAPNAGRARGRAMALAAAAAPHGILLTTDADGEPAPEWIAANLAGLIGADLVAGRVIRGRGPSSATQDRIELYYDRLHAIRRTIDPVEWDGSPAHHWTSGASLALRATTYNALGGFAPLANGEDAALCDHAMRSGYRVRRDAGVVVRTSSRRRGRADRGMAAMLAAFDQGAGPPVVAHPEDEAWRFRMQADARRLHGSGDYDGLSSRLRLATAEVAQVAGECRNGEAFAARIVGAPPGGMRMVSLGHAELLLAALEDVQLEGAA